MIQNNQNIFFTIIIPHYNLPFLLKRCLDSIPQRDDLEVIVVDDKSSEENICKLRELEPLYSNVKFLYSRINGGGGFARNIGLEEAQGKFVIFSDSDDFFCTEFNSILTESKKANADLYFFNVQTLDSETLKLVPIHHQLNDYIDKWSDDKDYAEMQLRYKFGEPWCKIVKKELINNNKIQFDEIRVHNDTRFSYLVGYYASKICVDNRVGYSYLVREGSVSKNKEISRDYIKINVFGKSSKFFKEHGLSVDEDRHWRALYHLLSFKPRSNFHNGISILKELGYSRKEIVWGYAKSLAQCGFYSPIRSFFFVPLLSIRISSIIAWFVYSVPRFFRFVLFGAKKETLMFFLMFGIIQSAFCQHNYKGLIDQSQTLIYHNGYKREICEDAFVFDRIRVDATDGREYKSDNYSSTDYIKIEGYNVFTYELPRSSSAGVAFYDNNKNIIPALAIFSKDGEMIERTIPSDAYYIRFSRRTDGNRSKNITLYGGTTVNQTELQPQNDGDSRLINQRYSVFSNDEYYIKKGTDDCLTASMPNHQMLNDGTIVAVTELIGDERYLAIKRSTDGGISWSGDIWFEDRKLNNGLITDNASGGNPVLLYDRINNTLFLFYQPRSYRKSLDGGLTWSDKVSIAEVFDDKYKGYRYYASPCNGIQLSNGILAIVYRIERIEDDYDRVCVLFSRDKGNTWELTPPTPIKDEKGNIIYADETALVEYKKNSIMLNARGFSEYTHGKQINRRVLVQKNKGSSNPRKWKVEAWELEPESDLKLMDPVCQGSLIKANLYGKEFGVFTNLYSNTGIRKNLLLRVSADYKHWSQCFFISAPNEVVHGYSSMCCINNIFSLMSEDERGIYYMPFNYELQDKLMRTYSENLNAYK